MNAGAFYSEEMLLPNVYHKGKYLVSIKRNIEDNKREITLTVDRNYQLDSLKITLCDDDDPCFLCVLIVTRRDYDELKQQQGLLVDFDNFPAQLLRLLQQVSSGNIFIVLQQSNPLQMYLEFIEHNEFKRLVHLSLKTSSASDSDLKKNMAENILNLKKIISNLKAKNNSSETLWNEKCHAMEKKMNDLSLNLSKLEDCLRKKELDHQEQVKTERDKHTQEKLELQKMTDTSLKSQINSHQELITRKEKQIDELNTRCYNYQDLIRTLEMQTSDKNQRLQQLEKQCQSCSAELDVFKAKCFSFERDLHEKEKSSQVLRQKNHDIEKNMKEKIDKMEELYDLVQSLKRDKNILEEKITHCESISTKHNLAMQATSEQLLKANQIIAKQNSDLVELKEKLMCRTAIALEQEKLIEKNDAQMKQQLQKNTQLETEADQLKDNLEKLKEECKTFESLVKEKDEIIKNNNLVIQWLQKKVDGRLGSVNDVLDPHITKTSRTFDSTPFLTTIRQFDSSRSRKENYPESMVNFYDTEEYSSEQHRNERLSPEFSAKSEANATASKFDIDPKYLKPLNRKESVENKTIQSERSLKSSLSAKSGSKTSRSLNGKEVAPHVKFSQRLTAGSSKFQDLTKSKDKFQISAYFPPK